MTKHEQTINPCALDRYGLAFIDLQPPADCRQKLLALERRVATLLKPLGLHWLPPHLSGGRDHANQLLRDQNLLQK
eukprot:4275012-Amphidinium_carterae.1